MNNTSKIKQFTTNLSILYIESDSTLQNKLGEYFNEIFSKVYQAFSTEEGLAKYEKYKPDIVLTDLTPSKTSAFEMILAIQDINQNANILTLSKINDDYELLKSFDVGLIEMLVKPLDFEILKKALQKASQITKKNIVDNELENLIVDTINKDKYVDFINNYKGLYLHSKEKIIKFDNNRLEIKVNRSQLISAIHEKKLIIVIDNKLILSKLVRVDKKNGILILSSPILLDHDARDPKNKRLDVDDKFKTSISSKGKHIDVEPLNISYNYLAVKTKNILTLAKNDTIELALGFEINGPSSFVHEKKFTKIFAKGEIQRLENFGNFQKLIIKITVNKAGENVFKNYLKQRELEIINEFKMRMKI
jgi:DNA-binding response OmpR family regulator